MFLEQYRDDRIHIERILSSYTFVFDEYRAPLLVVDAGLIQSKEAIEVWTLNSNGVKEAIDFKVVEQR